MRNIRNGDGKLELSPAVLGTIITACLAAGSGGAVYFTHGGATASGQAQAVTQGNLLDVRVAILEERARLSAESLTEIKQGVREIKAAAEAIDKKLDRHLARQ
jgi:hypothetical protein